MSNVFPIVTEFAVSVDAESSDSDPNFVMQNQLCHKVKYIKIQKGLVLNPNVRTKNHL